jgi:Fuc2NAc and GlcNAc transferase
VITTILLLLTVAVSALITWLVRRYAVRNAVLDHPNDRSSHVDPTPRGGGLAIIATSLLVLIAGVAANRVSMHHALALAPGIALLGLVGWRDDHESVGAAVRLLAHLAAAIGALAVLRGMPALRIGITTLHLGSLGSILAAVGIVWSINLFNFMDGIDGLAGSQAVIILGAAATLFHLRGDDSLAIIAAGFAASAAGFLSWNWPPAKIFMGDVGSGALGFMIAVLAIGGERDGSVPLIAFGILGGFFLADSTVTLLRRVRRGEQPMKAHRSHAYQRLTRAWGSHQPVTIAAAALTLALASVAAAATLRPALTPAAVVVALALLVGTGYMTERRAPM